LDRTNVGKQLREKAATRPGRGSGCEASREAKKNGSKRGLFRRGEENIRETSVQLRKRTKYGYQKSAGAKEIHRKKLRAGSGKTKRKGTTRHGSEISLENWN